MAARSLALAFALPIAAADPRQLALFLDTGAPALAAGAGASDPPAPGLLLRGKLAALLYAAGAPVAAPAGEALELVSRDGFAPVPVASLAEASRVALEQIARLDVGSSAWGGAEVRDRLTGRLVGLVSYNGRIWPPGEWTRDMRPLFDNQGGR